MTHAHRLAAGPGSAKSNSGCAGVLQFVAHGVPTAAHGAARVANRTHANTQKKRVRKNWLYKKEDLDLEE